MPISKTIKVIHLSLLLKAMFFLQSSTRVNLIKPQRVILVPTRIAVLRATWLILCAGSSPSVHRHALSGDVLIASSISFPMMSSSWMSARVSTVMLGLDLVHVAAIFPQMSTKSKFVRLSDSFLAPIKNSLMSSNPKWQLLLRTSTLSVPDVLKRVSIQLNRLLKPSTLYHPIGLTPT